jgi:hypothetical protein
MLDLNPSNPMDELKSRAVENEKSKPAGFMMPEEKKKKNAGGRPPDSPEVKAAKEAAKKNAKPGASPASASSPEANNPFAGMKTEDMCKPLMLVFSNIGVQIAGTEKAAMTQDETDVCAQATAAIVDKYLPSFGNKYGAECLLLLAFGGYAMRVNDLRKQVLIEKQLKEVYQSKPKSSDPREQETTPLVVPKIN